MTIRKLITIVEIDAEATECGACRYFHDGSDPEFAKFYDDGKTSHCINYNAYFAGYKRLPECLAAEAGTYQPTAPTRDQ